METNRRSLPGRFSHLEKYVVGWAAASSDARHHKRQISSIEEIRSFYSEFSADLEDVFLYLDGYSLDALTPEAQQLLRLAFGFIEASLAVEIFDGPGVTDSSYPHGFSVSREICAL